MASVILVVGFIGMIQAVAIGSEMLATARRQTLAAQIINHEMDRLRLLPWSRMPASGTETVTIDTQFAQAIQACGLAATDIELSRTTVNLDGLSNAQTTHKEVTFTVTWQKRGTTAEANAATGSWLQRLSFQRDAPIARTYTRSMTSWFTQHGLNHAIQRS